MSTSAPRRQFHAVPEAEIASPLSAMFRSAFCLSAVAAAYGIALKLEILDRDGPHLFVFLAAISLCASYGGPQLVLTASVLSVLSAVNLLAPVAHGPESVLLPLFAGTVLVLNFTTLSRQRRERDIAGERDAFAARLDITVAELERMHELVTVATQERAAAEYNLQMARDELTRMARTASAAELAAAIAHEINQPIAGATTQCAAAINWLERTPSDIREAINSVQAALKCSEHAADIVRELRNAITNEPLGTDLVDVNEVVLSAIGLSKHVATFGRENVECDLFWNLPRIRGSHIALQLVILNLLANAVEAMAGGKCNRLIVRSHLEDEDVCLEIADTGPGIPSDVEVFRSFYSTKATGLGMGLAICRHVVSAHSGTITCGNRKRGGAVFAIRIPAGVCSNECEPGDGLRG